MEKKKFLITGISGFVGLHFLNYLHGLKEFMEICGLDLNVPQYDIQALSDYLTIDIYIVDLLNADEFDEIIKNFQPNYLLHLASFSSVAYSWKNPVESFKNNTNIFLNIITSVNKHCPKCRVLSVGSSEEYGIVTQKQIPLKESQTLSPSSPYAIARVSQEMLAKLYVEYYGMDIILTRSFNHIGPYQDNRFVVPSYIDRILKIKKTGNNEGVIRTGNYKLIRDFVDVRDVVDAYYKLLMKGKKGELYNICSGKGVSLEKIIDIIACKVGVKVKAEIDEEFIRPNDNEVIIGDNNKIVTELNWRSSISIDETISDMINVYMAKE